MNPIIKLLPFAMALTVLAISCAEKPSQPSVAVTGVTLAPESIDLEIGDQKPLTATVSPSDATNKNVSFSSKESAATVSQDGIVEAVAAGKAIEGVFHLK